MVVTKFIVEYTGEDAIPRTVTVEADQYCENGSLLEFVKTREGGVGGIQQFQSVELAIPIKWVRMVQREDAKVVMLGGTSAA